MASLVTMPKLGLTMKVGSVAQWKVAEGASVKAGTVIAEIMTEKITSQLEAPAAGVLLKVVVGKGIKVPIGTALAVIGDVGEDISEMLAAAAAAAGPAIPAAAGGAAPAGGRVVASPVARKLAQELGLDIAWVTGTGPDGRISKEDVLAAQAAGVTGPPSVEAGAGWSGDEDGALKTPAETLEYGGIRRVIGEHMAMSWTVAPKVTQHVRVDVSSLLAFRDALNQGRREKDKVSLTALLVKATGTALRRRPRLNATLDGDTITLWQQVNVGVAVALPDGLIVPVVRDADAKGFGQISKEVKDLAARARRGRLLPDEAAGGTFTITNLGGYGSVDFFTPIINQPESAILGVGRVTDEVLAVAGVPTVRPAVGLSLSFDHRVVDGGPAAEFLAVLVGLLTNPMSMVL
jgi:pyruvate dehydrogenase E2 component (dihydrolipoamide acetyltransferase)